VSKIKRCIKRRAFFSNAILCLMLFSSLLARASDSQTMVDFAELIANTDAHLNAERTSLFALELAEQSLRHTQSIERLQQVEAEQVALKRQFNQTEQRLAEMEQALHQRSGVLGEVFGVARQHAKTLAVQLESSLTSAQFPGRLSALAFADSTRVPSLSDIHALHQQLLKEMRATGQVDTFAANVVGSDGLSRQQRVTRVGVFTAFSEDGQYLSWNPDSGVLSVLATQPGHTVDEASIDMRVFTVLVDPGRGELFALLDRIPKLMERIDQGGSVGYLIILLGLAGVVVAGYQLYRLAKTEIGVRRQLATPDKLDMTNTLGRVLTEMQRHSEGAAFAHENLETHVDEAILKELPDIERGQSFLKLLAGVAPLLGLLGTVVGMIETFQSITVFGTSDPKLMASGISQALMTTVLGLVVAIPILFCHSVLAARGRRLLPTLQEKSLGALLMLEGLQGQPKGPSLHVA